MEKVTRRCAHCRQWKGRNGTSSCIRCGHAGSFIRAELSSSATPRADLTYKSTRRKSTDGTLALAKGKAGDEFHADSQTWQFRRRQFNLANPEAPDSYQEDIDNPKTGFKRYVIGKLSEHIGHGSAKKCPHKYPLEFENPTLNPATLLR